MEKKKTNGFMKRIEFGKPPVFNKQYKKNMAYLEGLGSKRDDSNPPDDAPNKSELRELVNYDNRMIE